jgi:hypothetical protein
MRQETALTWMRKRGGSGGSSNSRSSRRSMRVWKGERVE